MCSIIIISFRKVHTYVLNYSKKKQTGGCEDGISRVIEEIVNGFSRGPIESNIEFPGVIKKKSCGIFRGIGFRP